MRNEIVTKSFLVSAIVVGSLIAVGTNANAGLLGATFDSSWKQFQENPKEDGYDESNGRVYPGWGGQDFDAEYLLYKIEGNTLRIGLQSGFDLIDGHVFYGNKDYYAGDLALSFDGDNSSYEYAVDFGLLTKDYDDKIVDTGSGDGTDTAGLYAKVGWNSNIPYVSSSPFAMDNGDIVGGALTGNLSGSGVSGGETSYFRQISLDLTNTLDADWAKYGFTLDAHWTMSCGNDAIDGQFAVAPVPEPATMLLFGTGLIGLTGMARRRKKK